MDLAPIEFRLLQITYLFFAQEEEGDLDELRFEHLHQISRSDAAGAMRTLAAKRLVEVRVPDNGELWEIIGLTERGLRYMQSETEAD